MKGLMVLMMEVALMATIPILFISQTIVPTALACVTNAQFWSTLLFLMLPAYMFIVRLFRYQRVNMIKLRYGFTDDFDSYKDMTPNVSQAVLKNLAEWDCPFVFEFGWISEFFKVRHDCGVHSSFSVTRITSFRLLLSPSQAYLKCPENVAFIIVLLSRTYPASHGLSVYGCVWLSSCILLTMLTCLQSHLVSRELAEEFPLSLSYSLSELLLRTRSSRNELMHFLGNLPCTYTSARLEPINALLTPDPTDCNCALSFQGHRQLWPLYEHGPVHKPRQTTGHRMSHDADAGSVVAFERACIIHCAYQRAS